MPYPGRCGRRETREQSEMSGCEKRQEAAVSRMRTKPAGSPLATAREKMVTGQTSSERLSGRLENRPPAQIRWPPANVVVKYYSLAWRQAENTGHGHGNFRPRALAFARGKSSAHHGTAGCAV
jgi:hypothetical protein